ncbi:DUF2846 domain-containing protein [Pseudomonas sp. PS02288]|uniref:DUF2846 domain-containing protein n=1 Tax=Pseudomonas sp. PS02288 TaxID=2991443 RepID=UPI00249A8071|nr:DUF2846 domain-containing protein [Pseudomonas sp. PS02288]
MYKLIVVATALLTLGGCASVPKGDPAQDAALKTFQVAPDKSAIYVYRNESMGAAVKMDVAIDGQAIGQTAAKTYLFKEVAPGKHTITSEAENTATLEVNTLAGKPTFVWQEVKMGVLSARSKLNLVDAEQGKTGVKESDLAIAK